jgi:hypothetical protein
MFVGIGIGLLRDRYGSGGSTPPPVLIFSTTQWQLITSNVWNSITQTWT